MKKMRKYKIGWLMTFISIGILLTACGKKPVVDYSDAGNWAVCENETVTDGVDAATSEADLTVPEADVFFVCPTAVGGAEGQLNMVISDEDSRAGFLAATLMEKGIYDDNARFFAPYYRQATLQIYDLPVEEQVEPLAIAYEDIKNAFDYYLENYNNGRPLILAGFSQGGDMVKRLMFDYGNDANFQDLLVATYMIGWYITDEELAQHPYVNMADGEADTGVIVSFCSESEDLQESIIVPEQTHGINPLNWKTDSTPAEKTSNTGACFVDGTGAITSEVPELTGAYLDEERGSLKVTDVAKEDYPAILSFLQEGNYHIYDYMFFYRNLEQNVQTRIGQYQTLKRISSAHFSKKTGLTMTDLLKAGEPETVDDEIYYASTVTNEMSTPEYWLRNLENADTVIMDREGIEAFHTSVTKAEPDPGCFEYYIGENRKTTLTEEELRSAVEVFDLTGEEREVYYTDGTLVEADFWEEMTTLRGSESIGTTNPVCYGVALESADIRTAPTALPISAGEEYDYCDEMQNSSVRMNERLIVIWTSTDGEWYFVVTPFCSGWISAEQVGVTKNYDMWMEETDPEDFLIVTANHAILDADPSNENLASRGLDMGTKLALVTDGSFTENDYNRHALNNYLVRIPCRDSAGRLYYENAYVPQNISVHRGYLEYTQRNLVTLAFASLGEQYGWGGQYGNRDCSQYMMEIYKCFGINLPRNTKGMMLISNESLNLTDIGSVRKGEILEQLPVGALLLFPGHVMMYLGEKDGQHYCISATGSARLSYDGEVIRIRSVMVNSLEKIWRGSGKTWLDSLTMAKVVM